jgi:hypothetical protein
MDSVSVSVSVSLALAGLGANLGGGILGQNDALANATAQANARNAVVQSAIQKLNAFGAQNETTMSNLLTGYSAPAQAAQLANNQAKREANNVSAITTQDPNAIPIQADASPATKADLAKRMLAAHDFAVSRAKAKGALGGYSDTWLTNELNNSQAGRDIMTVNNAAEGRKALVGPESDLAAAAAYKPPSMWSALLSGLGSIGVAAGAKGGSFAGYNYPTDFAPDLSGDDVSLSEAAKAGVQSGLKFNAWTGNVF